jgi:hypothetical protein
MADAPSLRPLDYGARPARRLTLASDGAIARRKALAGMGFEDDLSVHTRELAELGEFRSSGERLWVELAEQPDAQAVAMLDSVQLTAVRSTVRCVLSATSQWIDLIAARIVAPDITVLIDPDEVERLGALGFASAVVDTPVGEGSSDRSEARLRQLSEEVNRIAQALARLSDAPVSPDTVRPVQPNEGPAVSAELVRSIIRARRLRDQFMPGNLFADPAWGILLDLLQAEIVQHRVPVSSLCIASAVPATTALRWIKIMTDNGSRRARALSSVGRALPLHGRCRRFEPVSAHQFTLRVSGSAAPEAPPMQDRRRPPDERQNPAAGDAACRLLARAVDRR